jgi:hypothetical protein
MDISKIEEKMWQIIREAVEIGPGYAQEGYVLRTTWEQLGSPRDLATERMILDVWNRFIREGRIVWGHNMSNPTAPFFHIPTS